MQLLCQKFSGDQNNLITEEQASTELLTLSEKKDQDLYAFYRRKETLLIGIFKSDQKTHNRENAFILNNTK